MFDVQALRSGYGEMEVLKDLTFSVKDEIFAVLGANGAGKTTLLKTLARLLPITAPASAQCGGGADPEVARRVVPQQSGVSPGGQLAIAVVLFAFSTMISWSYYGLKAWTYLFGEGKVVELIFKLIFCVFVVIGAAASLGPVIDFSDAAIFAMAVVNIIALYFLMKVVRAELASYSARLKSGEIKKFKG